MQWRTRLEKEPSERRRHYEHLVWTMAGDRPDLPSVRYHLNLIRALGPLPALLEPIGYAALLEPEDVLMTEVLKLRSVGGLLASLEDSLYGSSKQ